MSDLAKLIGAGIVSIVLLAAGMYILLERSGDETLQKTAAGWIGLVAGYWLK